MLLRPKLLAGLAWLLLATGSPAQSPDPMRFIPSQADVCIKIEKPRELIEGLVKLDAVKRLDSLSGFRDLLASTGFRRFQQLIAYYERDLSADWPELLDQLAGGGVVLAVKYGPDPAPTALVVQGRDAAKMKAFTELFANLAEQELARQDVPVKVERGDYRGVSGMKIGDAFLALVDSALIVCNKKEVLQLILDGHLDKTTKPLSSHKDVIAAKALVGGQPLVWGWANLVPVKQLPEVKDVYKLPRGDPGQTVLIGGILDSIGRSDFVAMGLFGDMKGYRLSFQLPAGHEGMPEPLVLHAPLKDPQAGSLPPLAPKGLLVSDSRYYDLSAVWEQRQGLFNAQEVSGLEGFSKQSAAFLGGTPFGKLVSQVGPHWRFLAATTDLSYKTRPAQILPAFGMTVSMKDPQFGRSMEAILRSAALLGGNPAGLQLVEETIADVEVVGYRFPEDKPLRNDLNNIRFNFTPCFTTVGDQFVVCSRLELIRELIPMLKKEQAEGRKYSPKVWQVRTPLKGVADFLQAAPDVLLAQTILDQAVPVADAKREVAEFTKWLSSLGSLWLQSEYAAKSYRLELGWRFQEGGN